MTRWQRRSDAQRQSSSSTFRPSFHPGPARGRRFMSHKLAVLGLAILLNMAFDRDFCGSRGSIRPDAEPPAQTAGGARFPELAGTDRSGRDTFSRVGVRGPRLGLRGRCGGVDLLSDRVCRWGNRRTDGRSRRQHPDAFHGSHHDLSLIHSHRHHGRDPRPSIINVMVIIGIFGWPGLARLIRGQIWSSENWTSSSHRRHWAAACGTSSGATCCPTSSVQCRWRSRSASPGRFCGSRAKLSGPRHLGARGKLGDDDQQRPRDRVHRCRAGLMAVARALDRLGRAGDLFRWGRAARRVRRAGKRVRQLARPPREGQRLAHHRSPSHPGSGRYGLQPPW